MKHKHSNRILGRTANHRQALLKQLASDLLRHGSIVTTEAKGKELRRFFEPLVTLAKQQTTLHRHRQLLKILRSEDIARLRVVAEAAAKRPGGYLRLSKLVSRRNDFAKTVRVDIIDGKQS